MFINPHDLYTNTKTAAGQNRSNTVESVFEMNGVGTLRSVGDTEAEDGSLQRGKGLSLSTASGQRSEWKLGSDIPASQPACSRAQETQLLSPRASTTKACAPRACAP